MILLVRDLVGKEKKVRLALFVHDLFLEVGHSNALIETVRNLPTGCVDEVKVIAFTSDNLETLFGNLDCRLTFVKVPFPNLYPHLFKIIFFHLWTLLYSWILLERRYIRIGVGIASLAVDVVNVQFVHNHWSEFYFKMNKLKGVSFIYKKIFFYYLNIVESFLYSLPNLKFSILSRFTTEFCQHNFSIEKSRSETIYSGINLEKFSIDERDRSDLMEDLSAKYPVLVNIDLNQEIFLFVGAFERKGLAIILEKLERKDKAQIIIIGTSESKKDFLFSSKVDCFHITFTDELPLFYSLADAFVFASLYEPFGLVILEAAAMGLELYISRENVGAVELLEGVEGINVFNNWDVDFLCIEVKKQASVLVLHRNP